LGELGFSHDTLKHEALVALQFSRLNRPCRFEKDGYRKERRKGFGPQTAPKPENKDYDHF
jgi:hypothetical protein